MKISVPISIRLTQDLADKIEQYTQVNFDSVYGYQSKAISELLEFAFETKEILATIDFNDPTKMHEIVEVLEAKKDNEGMLNMIDNLPEQHRKGIYQYLQQKLDGTWQN